MKLKFAQHFWFRHKTHPFRQFILFEIEDHPMRPLLILNSSNHHVCEQASNKRYILDGFIVMLWTFDVSVSEFMRKISFKELVMRIVMIFITALSI